MPRTVLQISLSKHNTMFKRKPALMALMEMKSDKRFKRPIAERMGRYNYVIEDEDIAFSRIYHKGYCSATCITDSYEERGDQEGFILFNDLKETVKGMDIDIPEIK